MLYRHYPEDEEGEEMIREVKPNNEVMPNFIEVKTVQEANRINLNVYSFVRYSETKNCYIFKKRREFS